MGTWGTAIFSNDEACDIRTEYNALAAYIDDDEVILQKLKKYFQIGDTVDNINAAFWYTLAALQTKYGRLHEEVKNNALECIDKRYTMDGWFSKKDCIKREKELLILKNQLIGEQIQRRKVPKPKCEKAIWNENDIIAYHLVNIVENQWNKPSDYWFYGKYVLLKIVKVIKTPVSKIMPELVSDEWVYCSIYDWIGDEIPDMKIIDNLNFHPISYNEYRKEHDYVANIYSKVVNPFYKRKHDAVVIGNDTSNKLPPRLAAYPCYSADVIELLLSKMPKFTVDEIGYYNVNGMP